MMATANATDSRETYLDGGLGAGTPGGSIRVALLENIHIEGATDHAPLHDLDGSTCSKCLSNRGNALGTSAPHRCEVMRQQVRHPVRRTCHAPPVKV